MPDTLSLTASTVHSPAYSGPVTGPVTGPVPVPDPVRLGTGQPVYPERRCSYQLRRTQHVPLSLLCAARSNLPRCRSFLLAGSKCHTSCDFTQLNGDSHSNLSTQLAERPTKMRYPLHLCTFLRGVCIYRVLGKGLYDTTYTSLY